MSEKTPDTVEENDKGVIAYMFANDKSAHAHLFPLLKMFYDGVYDNTVGIMQAFDKDENKEVLLLVGITHEMDGTTSTIPLAKILMEEALDNLEIPDGQGGWMEVGDQWSETDVTEH